MRRDMENSPARSPCAQTKERPREDPARRWLSSCQEDPTPQELSLLDLDLGLPSLQNCGKRNFYGLSHAICHILLQQPREVNTDSKTGLGISLSHPGGLGEAGVMIIHSANTYRGQPDTRHCCRSRDPAMN